MTERLARRATLVAYALGITLVMPTALQGFVAGGFTVCTWAYLAAVHKGRPQPMPELGDK